MPCTACHLHTDVAELESDVWSQAGTGNAPQLASMFAPPTQIICTLPLERAKNLAVREHKWILVNLQLSDEFDCHRLNRDTFAQPDVQGLIRDNFVFWQRWANPGTEAAQLKVLYSLDIVPSLIILHPRTGAALWKYVGLIEAPELQARLLEFLSLHPTSEVQPPRFPRETAAGQASHSTAAAAAAAAAASPAAGMVHDLTGEADDTGSAPRKIPRVDEDAQAIAAATAASLQDQLAAGNQYLVHVGDSDDEYSMSSDDMSVDERAPSGAINPVIVALGAAEIPNPPPGEAPRGAPNCTRVQFRMPDGSRVVRAVPLASPVCSLYATVSALMRKPHSLASRWTATQYLPATDSSLCSAAQEVQSQPPTELQADDTWDIETVAPVRSLAAVPDYTLESVGLKHATLHVRAR